MEAVSTPIFSDTETNKKYGQLSEKCGRLNDYINKIVSELEKENGVSVSIIKGSKTMGNKFSASLSIDGKLFSSK